MELDITDFFTTAEPFEFSASMAERGANAGPQTWANAKREASERPLLTTESELEAAKDFFAGFGAWDDDELTAMGAEGLNALLIQFISGDIREAESVCPSDDDTGIDWDAYEALSAQGTVSGRMFRSTDGRIYFLVD